MTASYSPASLEALVAGLSLADGEPDHERILEHANNVLKSAKGNLQALQAKVVALLHLDRHEDALRIFETDGNKGLGEAAPLEHAYCLYKLGRLEDAVALVGKAVDSSGSPRALQHVAAQAYYRLEKFQETARICKTLAESPSEAPNEDGDLRVNAAATDAQLVWAGRHDLVGDKKTPREDLDVFEATFNAACLSIAKQEYRQALVLLKRAKQLCHALEDLSDEEKSIELEPVVAQEIFVLAKTGQNAQAAGLVAELASGSISDQALKVISVVNSIALSYGSDEYNPYLAWENYHEAVKHATSLASRPFGFQARSLCLNEAILNLEVGKTEAARKRASDYRARYPTDQNINVINAAARTANKNGREVTTKIEQIFEKDPKDIGLALALVQLRMTAGNVTGANSVLDKLLESLDPATRYSAGLVGLRLALYEAQGRKKDTQRFLSEASAWLQASSTKNFDVLKVVGRSKLESEDPTDLLSAREIFSSLLQQNPSDRMLAAGLVASYATIEPSKVSIYADKLSTVDSLTAGINIDALESAGIAHPSRKRGPAEEIVQNSRPTKIRKKKPRLPKNYDPSKKPDPERWLPMRDRSYYKPKGRKDKKKAAAVTQGGPVEESMELAGGGRVDVVKVDQSKKPGSGGGGTNKKKKKKGGKW